MQPSLPPLAFMADYDGEKVFICDDVVTLTGCAASKANFSGPTSVDFYESLDYVTNYGSNTVSICSNSTAMDGCVVSLGNSTFQGPSFI